MLAMVAGLTGLALAAVLVLVPVLAEVGQLPPWLRWRMWLQLWVLLLQQHNHLGQVEVLASLGICGLGGFRRHLSGNQQSI